MTRGCAIAALVPVRGLAAGKQRLAAVLTAAERRALTGAMLEDVLAVLCGCAAVESVAVVTDDAAAAALAGEYGALVLPDVAGGLNGSLENACAWARTRRPAASILIVAADLPSITGALLEHRLLSVDAEVVIARSEDGGTNALLLRPPAALELSFGPGSCERHRAAAVAAGRSVHVIDDPDLALDLDWPADLAAHLFRARPGQTRHLLHRLHLHDRPASGAARVVP